MEIFPLEKVEYKITMKIATSKAHFEVLELGENLPVVLSSSSLSSLLVTAFY